MQVNQTDWEAASARSARAHARGDAHDEAYQVTPPQPRHHIFARSTRSSKRSANGGEHRLADALGWFSVALGVAELAAPRGLADAIGAPASASTMRLLGARELASGIGILTQSRKSPWLWSRVAGDAMDLALLGRAASMRGSDPLRLAIAAAAVAGVTALDVQASRWRSEHESIYEPDRPEGMVRVEEVAAINRTPDECYRFWRNLENLPRFMKHVRSVSKLDERRSHWVASEAGMELEWDAEILRDEPGKLIQWHTLPGADVPHSGLVLFEPESGGRGTVVRIEMEYSAPGGKLAGVFATLFGKLPSHQVREDVRRFKQLLETGEIPTTLGQPSGRRSALSRLFFRKGLPG